MSDSLILLYECVCVCGVWCVCGVCVCGMCVCVCVCVVCVCGVCVCVCMYVHLSVHIYSSHLLLPLSLLVKRINGKRNYTPDCELRGPSCVVGLGNSFTCIPL